MKEFKHIICYRERSEQFKTSELEEHLKDGWKIEAIFGTAHNDVLISK